MGRLPAKALVNDRPRGMPLSSFAILAVVGFRRAGFTVVTSVPRHPPSVKTPAVTNELTVGKLTAWLEGGEKNLGEQAPRRCYLTSSSLPACLNTSLSI